MSALPIGMPDRIAVGEPVLRVGNPSFPGGAAIDAY
jgi:hypothetical protein